MIDKALTWWSTLESKKQRSLTYLCFTSGKDPKKLTDTEIQKIWLNDSIKK